MLAADTMTTRSDSTDSGSPRPVYTERVNAAIDFIEAHLGEDLTLAEVADAAHFSRYHFHRVFAMITGETLGHFISRLRLERAAALLVQQPGRAITAIASDTGFPNPSSFSRAFRNQFTMTATEWRNGGHRTHKGKPGYADPTNRSGFGILSRESIPGGTPPTWRIGCGDLEPATLTVERVPDLEVAYLRHIGKYQGQAEVFADLFHRLTTWAEPRGLLLPEGWVLAVYHDNPSITADDDLRVSACVDVPEDTVAAGDVGRMSLPGGTAAVGHFELGDQDYGQAWTAVVSWLPDSGYEPDDRLPFERYFVDDAARTGKTAVDIYLPVRPLQRY
jgi:AraC family transcriptional regulator